MPPRELLTGRDVREVFEAVLPEDALGEVMAAARLQQRQRRLDGLLFVRSMVIAASTGYGGRQADVMRLYFKSGGPKVVRGGFYAWFGPALEKTMEEVSRRALAFARQQPVDLPPLLAAHASDWHIVDSSTVRLPDELLEEYPGTGDYAALKVHKRFSVGTGTVWDYHLSPAREHDAPHLVIDESWKGLGLLADLGYASLDLLRRCEAHSVSFVVRLKESWKPRVDRLYRGEVGKTFAPGTDFDLLLLDESILLRGRAIDADVTIGPPSAQVRCRLVAVRAPDGTYRFYLTNLPRSAGPHQVSDIYRVRWEIESDNKLDKSCNHLDDIAAQTGPAARSLVHAALVSSLLAGLLAHRHRLKEGRPRRGQAQRTAPPIHPQALARAMGCAARDIAMLLHAPAAENDDLRSRWQFFAEYLQHLAEDANWRRSPSILDQMRGWKITPGQPRRTRLASPTTRVAN
jgi:Transposase DDE domain